MEAMADMSAGFPDTGTIRTALSMATRAPSVHNSQPWRWRVGPLSLHLHADQDRHLPSTDPDGRDLILSCGASLHHCIVALAALGWQAKVHRLPNPADPDHLAAIELQPSDVGDLDVTLAAAIPRRRTDRRNYSQWPVAHRDIALMGARAARAGVTLRRIEHLAPLAALVRQAVMLHGADDAYLTELTTWSGRYGSTAGVPARNTPEPDRASRLPGRAFAGPALAQPPDVPAADDNTVVVALGTGGDDQLARLRAGEATSLVLLTATALGLASCAVTEPLEIPETRAAVRAEFLGSGAFPQILLRVGWASLNADPLPPTPRRALTDVVTRLDGSSFE
jgi:nitroreductase